MIGFIFGETSFPKEILSKDQLSSELEQPCEVTKERSCPTSHTNDGTLVMGCRPHDEDTMVSKLGVRFYERWKCLGPQIAILIAETSRLVQASG